MKLVIASNNANKVKEIRAILGDKFENIYSMKDLGINVDAEETATTFIGNALIKARAVAEFTDYAVLADDSGLEVAALNNAPGVYSARYAGEHANDKLNNELLLKNLAGKQDRNARFVCTMVLLFANGDYKVGNGEVKGHILESARGYSGFGYDPLFYCDELGQTFGEASENDKNSVSHRARALQDLLLKLW